MNNCVPDGTMIEMALYSIKGFASGFMMSTLAIGLLFSAFLIYLRFVK